MNFLIDDSTPKERLPICIEKARLFLENLEDGKLYTTAKLCEKANVNFTSFKSQVNHKSILDFKTRQGNINIWGNKNTVQEFENHMENLND